MCKQRAWFKVKKRPSMVKHGWPLVTGLQTLGRRGQLLLRRYRLGPNVLGRHGSWFLRLRFRLARPSLFEWLSCNQQFDLGGIQRLAFEKRFSDPNQRVTIFR